MCDPKEVIQGLTQCTQPNEGVWCICTNPVACPYLNTECCEWHLMDDALTLLQKQQARIKELEAAQTAKAEPKTVQAIGYLGVSFDRFGKCPWCNKRIRDYESEHYCGHCGKAVKWDATD